VAELVSWHHHTLNAYGLGNYIATASIQGRFALLIAGGIVMSAFVVIVNRLFWRRLYRLAETRYAL
jgi:NitT/TauT family transport system permease protein